MNQQELDAERYRWLRSRFDDNWSGAYFVMRKGCYKLKQAKKLDRAIDTAIKMEQT